MTTSTKKQLYEEYINPTIEQYSLEKENPLVLMAQACNNIGKSSFSPTISSKQRKKSLKRSAPTNCSLSSTKKSFVPQSSFMFDSLFYHHLNKTNSLLSTSSFNYSPSFHRSSYLMDSILSSPPFVCNWINSTISDGFCGKRFNNYIHLLEHLCTEHTSIKSSYTSY